MANHANTILLPKTSGGASLWIVLLHLSQIESRKPRIKENLASPEPTITQPSRRTLFVLNVTDCSMHELNSLVICTPINLRDSFTVVMVIIIFDGRTKILLQTCCTRGCKIHQWTPFNMFKE